MSEITMAAAAAPFDRNLERCFHTIEGLITEAKTRSVDLLVLPEAALGGYVETIGDDATVDMDPPPAFDRDGPELKRVMELAGDMTVCVGFCEDGGPGVRYNAAACLSGDGLHYVHRKVHLPLREDRVTTAAAELSAFDTPVGRLGMLICYDKAFPEASRTLALDGAQALCFLSAWPRSATNFAEELTDDRQWRRSELWDRSRAAENSMFVASANQTGVFGSLHFLGGARITNPNGDVLDVTGTTSGIAYHRVDLEATVEKARRALSPIRDLRPDSYASPQPMRATSPLVVAEAGAGSAADADLASGVAHEAASAAIESTEQAA
ncbi:MAG: carbon-nitrogen hydrolase family protein [Solirubrobacteraceae bacterium]|nr:carbon-nitrogen hydrolase family protein [Solirubrobacteraceae bacterium]